MRFIIPNSRGIIFISAMVWLGYPGPKAITIHPGALVSLQLNLGRVSYLILRINSGFIFAFALNWFRDSMQSEAIH